jgi:hypothetical protein
MIKNVLVTGGLTPQMLLGPLEFQEEILEQWLVKIK